MISCFQLHLMARSELLTRPQIDFKHWRAYFGLPVIGNATRAVDLWGSDLWTASLESFRMAIVWWFEVTEAPVSYQRLSLAFVEESRCFRRQRRWVDGLVGFSVEVVLTVECWELSFRACRSPQALLIPRDVLSFYDYDNWSHWRRFYHKMDMNKVASRSVKLNDSWVPWSVWNSIHNTGICTSFGRYEQPVFRG